MKALIDGDIVCYSAGFANVNKEYTCPDNTVWRYKKEAVEHCRKKDLDESGIVRSETVGPLEFALANVKRTINKIMEKTECTDYVVYLSGSENFRKEVDDTYKLNRESTPKPPYLEDMKDYLINVHDAVVTGSKLEADDYMGMAATDDTIICTLDKDLDQIQGHHYNWRSDKMYYVTSDEADLWFWMQMLIGDPADNIKGVPSIGEVRALQKLADVEPERRRCVVGLEYAAAFDDPEEKYKTNSQLLYIMR